MSIKPPAGYVSVTPLMKSHRVALPTGDEAPGFVRNRHSLPVSFSEVALASRDYPIAFASNDAGDGFTLVAILGLQKNQNMFLIDDGYWDRRVYVPAYVRRFPFCMATVQGSTQNERVVCVENSAIKEDGDELFDDDGNALPVLSDIRQFVEEYESDLRRAEEFCTMLAGYSLLEPISVTAELGEFKLELPGLYRVKRDALAKLPPETLQTMFETEAIDTIFAHLWSLRNFQRLLSRRSVITPTVEVETRSKPN